MSERTSFTIIIASVSSVAGILLAKNKINSALTQPVDESVENSFSKLNQIVIAIIAIGVVATAYSIYKKN